MDFQIREPLHPLLGAMKKTNVMMAVQAAQECRCSNSIYAFFFDFHRSCRQTRASRSMR